VIALGSEMLVKAVEREALVAIEGLVNVMDAQGQQAWASSTIMIGRVAWVLVRLKRVVTHFVLGSTHRGVSGHPLPCTLREIDHHNSLIFSENRKWSFLRWLR